MAKIIFLTSIMLLSFYSSEQTKLSLEDNIVVQRNKLTRPLNVSTNNNATLEKEHSLLLCDIRFKTKDPKYVSDDYILKTFDSRTYWPRCKTIGEVHNKGNSSFDLAFAATGALADRMCIATNGTYNKLLSAAELISCSGQYFYNEKVHILFGIWDYLKKHGVVSGGKYNSNDGCQPFQVPPISELPTYHNRHKCIRQCYGNKSINYNNDHVKVKDWYVVNARGTVEYVQKEIQAYGPLVAYFDLYDDFFFYKSGVYEKSKTAKFVRFQHAKLIGWGVENGVEYWLLVHSIGYDWGQNGLFKIKKGSNECHIEDWITGVVPKI